MGWFRPSKTFWNFPAALLMFSLFTASLAVTLLFMFLQCHRKWHNANLNQQ